MILIHQELRLYHRRIQRFCFLYLAYIRPKESKIDRDLENDDSDPSRIKVVSSAYSEILLFVSSTLNPLITLLFLIALPKISTQRRKRDKDNGHPFLSRGKIQTPIRCLEHSY